MQHPNRLLVWWGTVSPMGRTVIIGLAFPLIVINAWALAVIFDYFHSLLVVLIAASLLAFLLNYPVSVLDRATPTGRNQASLVVFLLALSVILALGLTLVPLALSQAQQLVVSLPKWIDSGQKQILTLNDQLDIMGFDINLDVLSEQVNDRLRNQIQGITQGVFDLALLTVSSLVDFLITLVLTFYLLQHGDEVWGSVTGWLPEKLRQPFSQTLRLSFQNFFLGQLILATCIGTALTVLFVILRVPFGLLFGLTVGTMALVPFGGVTGIVLVTLLVALRDFWLGAKVLALSVLVQQVIENLVAPRVLGSVTGLSPVWVFVSILTGARIGGLLGVIVAVPTAVVLKSALVILRSPKGSPIMSPLMPAFESLADGVDAIVDTVDDFIPGGDPEDTQSAEPAASGAMPDEA
ncbi:AI-2E family transporter [filamentous cyanobacterium LEGE 11480]|uniref:AI-2E family transporter n=1 Tax=Romeriopsis navalis LEGE 11480 TaxID=2777977 RepID=A0A928VPV7_9CYAN|nr:AI-2E family transporter [Romeriopsis navalis]MBE9029939.1 AI-2E family transporter [Romeriopsis navalis LEGE 11480]